MLRRRNFLMSLASVLLPLGDAAAGLWSRPYLPRVFFDPQAALRLGRELVIRGEKLPPRAAVPSDFENRHQRDLQRGNVVVVNGWIISRSEAGACMQLVMDDGGIGAS